MKRILSGLLLTIICTCLYAQKAPKPPPTPSVTKALKLFKSGKFTEAKDIIDQVPDHPKTVNDPKAWLYRGIILLSLDSSGAYPGNKSTLLPQGLEAVRTAQSKSKPGKEVKFSKQDPTSDLTIQLTPDQLLSEFTNAYFVAAEKAVQIAEDKNDTTYFAKGLDLIEKGVQLRQDTLVYYYAGAVAFKAGRIDKSIEFFEKYADAGGVNPNYLRALVGMLFDESKYEKVLARSKSIYRSLPNITGIRELEFNSLIRLNRMSEAKVMQSLNVKANPKDDKAAFMLGQLFEQVAKEYAKRANDFEDAKKLDSAQRYYAKFQVQSDSAALNFKTALKLDPSNFDYAVTVANYSNNDFRRVQREMDKLDYKKDRAKKDAMFKDQQKLIEIALKNWQYCDKINPNQCEILDQLVYLYEFLGDKQYQQDLLAVQNRQKSLNCPK